MKHIVKKKRHTKGTNNCKMHNRKFEIKAQALAIFNFSEALGEVAAEKPRKKKMEHNCPKTKEKVRSNENDSITSCRFWHGRPHDTANGPHL